jgi:hypothetical protein
MRLAKGVDVAPLVSKTLKPTGKDYYCAPLLFIVQDKTKKGEWRRFFVTARSTPVSTGYRK